ncbi:MAG: LL-diaminopimelate aminotransferase [Vampirovibrio sp.]
MPSPSSKSKKLPPYLFAEIDQKVAEAKAKGVDIISLGIGDPDLPTPELIVQALQVAVEDPDTHNYPPYHGTAEFRQAAAAWMHTRFGVTVNAETDVLSLIGSKEGIAHMILAYVEDENDIILCPSPGYPVYENYTLLCGGTPYTMPLLPENNMVPDLSAIPEDIAKRAKLLWLNYPNNPTGAIIQDEKIKEVITFCKKYDILLCHDNAYSEMTYDGYQSPSFLAFEGAKDVCVEFFSLSKMYNMTGWRVGFATGNTAAVQALGTLKNNTDSGVFKAIQKAAAVGLNHSASLTAGLNEIYGKRRRLFVEGLRELGWDIPMPEATFYLWLPVPKGFTSVEFVSVMLEKAGIVVPPGNGYGSVGEGYFRVALTVPDARLNEALTRMKDAGIRYDMAPNVANACSL